MTSKRAPAQRVPSTHVDQSLQHLTELVKTEALSIGGGKELLHHFRRALIGATALVLPPTFGEASSQPLDHGW